MLFGTGGNRRAIEDHFDKAHELGTELERKGKDALLAQVRSVLPAKVGCIYIRQPEPLGLGHAVLCAQPAVGSDPFAVLLADDLIDANPPAMARMAQVFEKEGVSLLGVEEVPRDQTQSYGIVTIEGMQGDMARIHSIVEKPRPDEAPSNLAVIGRYVLTPRIFDLLAQVTPGAGGEIQPLLRFPLDLDYIHASRYGAETRGASIDWRVAPPPGVRGRAVLVLDDILDGGETMAAIRERLLALGAASFACAVLVEKKLS